MSSDEEYEGAQGSFDDESIDEDTAFTAEDYARFGDIGGGMKRRREEVS
jgi:hypothetical protein